jgi:hypothetical protein
LAVELEFAKELPVRLALLLSQKKLSGDVNIFLLFFLDAGFYLTPGYQAT